MRHLKKGRRADRAHQYRVVANQLSFHLQAGQYHDGEVVDAVRTARGALLRAAQLLENDEPRGELREVS